MHKLILIIALFFGLTSCEKKNEIDFIKVEDQKLCFDGREERREIQQIW